jgi:glycosyltransferase involved in cell wall biosynthesis
VCNGRTGTIVPLNDDGAMARAILELLADRAQAGLLGSAARQWAQRNLGWSDLIRAIDVLYQNALPNGGQALRERGDGSS